MISCDQTQKRCTILFGGLDGVIKKAFREKGIIFIE